MLEGKGDVLNGRDELAFAPCIYNASILDYEVLPTAYKHRGRAPPRNQKLRATSSPLPPAHVSDMSRKLY